MINNSFSKRYKKLPIATSESVNCDTEVHNHSEFEILYIEKGSSEFSVGGKTFTARENDIVFINPMQVHSIKRDKSGLYRHKCICFDSSIITNKDLGSALNSEALTIKNLLKNSEKYSSEIAKLILLTYNACINESVTFEMEVTSYITLIFTYLIKSGLIEKQNYNKSNDFCTLIIDYIKNHYHENITSKQASTALNFNQSYFCRNFKLNFGTSFSAYLNAYRISVSRRFLEESKKNITQIAYDVGFSSPASFTKSFKQQMGILPSEYKK